MVHGPHSIARLDRRGCETIPPAQSLKRPKQESRDARDHGLHMEGSACGSAIGPEAAEKRMRVEISTHIDRTQDMDQLGTRREMDGKSHERAAREMGCSPLEGSAAGSGEEKKLC